MTTSRTPATAGTFPGLSHQPETQLDKLRRDFREWRTIYGDDPAHGYEEPADRAETRRRFRDEIAKLEGR